MCRRQADLQWNRLHGHSAAIYAAYNPANPRYPFTCVTWNGGREICYVVTFPCLLMMSFQNSARRFMRLRAMLRLPARYLPRWTVFRMWCRPVNSIAEPCFNSPEAVYLLSLWPLKTRRLSQEAV